MDQALPAEQNRPHGDLEEAGLVEGTAGGKVEEGADGHALDSTASNAFAAPPRASLMGLSNELLHLILVNSANGQDHLSHARVCHAFLAILQPLIWHELELRYLVAPDFTVLDWRTSAQLDALLTYPHLGRFVQRLAISTWAFDTEFEDIDSWTEYLFKHASLSARRAIQDWDDHRIFAAIASPAVDFAAEVDRAFRFLSNVQDVSYLVSDPTMAPPLLSAPRPTVTSLRLPHLPPTFSAFPSLQKLEVFFNDDDPLPPSAFTPQAVPPTLTSFLCRARGDRQHADLQRFLHWFLPTCAPHLRDLSLQYPSSALFDPSSSSGAPPVVLPALTHLDLSTEDGLPQHPSVPLSSLAPNLLSLSFGNNRNPPVTLSLRHSLFAALPLSLATLRLPLRPFPASFVLDLLATSSSSSSAAGKAPQGLKRLELWSAPEKVEEGRKRWTDQEWSEVEKRCEAGGVKLVLES